MRRRMHAGIFIAVVGCSAVLGLLRAESAEDQLWDAVSRGSLAEARETLAEGVDVKYSRRPFLTAALSRRDIPMIELLIAAGADANRLSPDGLDPLILAVAIRQLPTKLLDQVVAARGTLNVTDSQGGL